MIGIENDLIPFLTSIEENAVLFIADDRHNILGVSMALNEAEVDWRDFLKSLLARIARPELIVSDAHAGLKETPQACLSSLPWQRCQFHLRQNTLQRALGRSEA